MANLMDYLDWRGDLTFREAPFNEVDNLILAQLVYVEFAGIVPAPGEEGTITVKEACELFFAAHDRKEIMERVSMTKTAAFVLRRWRRQSVSAMRSCLVISTISAKRNSPSFLWYVSGWMIRVSMYLSAEQTIRLWAGARTLTWVICPRHRGS